MLSRRSFLKLSLAGGAATFVATRGSFLRRVRAAQSPQTPLDPKPIDKFVDPLPDLLASESVIVDDGTPITLEMREQVVNILPAGAVPGYTGTYVWSYLKPGQTSRTSYLGPAIVATRHQPTELKFVNQLGEASTTALDAYKYSTDQTLHWADPLHDGENMWNHMANPPAVGSEGAENYLGSIPAVVHLHGGEVPSVLDGGPNSWVTSDGQHQGFGFYSRDIVPGQNWHTYRYPNSQEGAPIWFHDHTLGATRLNVYMGLAGAYVIVDPANDPINLPPLVPLVIQDRMFDTDGQLFFPADSAGGIQWSLNPQHPYWVPEFIGDTICVNGKAWPYLEVQRKRYTFLFLNGSNARSYNFFLVDPISGNVGPAFWVIGTDGGYLDKPARIGQAPNRTNDFIMMPGERYQVIIDFAGYQAGVIGPNGSPYSGNWRLMNTAGAPLPSGEEVDPDTTAKIMQFNVVGNKVTDLSFNPAMPGARVRPKNMVRLVDAGAGTVAKNVIIHKTRQLTLNEIAIDEEYTEIDPVTGKEVLYEGGPLEILVNNTKWDGKRITGITGDMYDMEPIPGFTLDSQGVNYLSETPNEGETEVWEIVNMTMDAHPIHTHLVQFQLLNRQDVDIEKYELDYEAAFPGGYNYVKHSQEIPGVYIPAFGPPLDYRTGNPRALGGNPDIAAKSHGKPLYLLGNPIPPLPQEAGWKDVVRVMPGQVTRFVVRWAPTDIRADTPSKNAYFSFNPNDGNGYVWHCHIVDHEDNEMMRPDEVQPNPNATRTYIKGVDY